MTWFDFLLMAFMASLVSFGIKKKMAGLLVGLGASLIFRLLLGISASSYFLVGIVLAMIAGLILGLLGIRLNTQFTIPDIAGNILGGIGGSLLGILMVLAVITSFPLGKNINGVIVYPSHEIKPSIRAAVQQSYLVNIGRNILLYPLLKNQNYFDDSQDKVYEVLHRLIVVGKPWEKEL